mmetsp:Transcript_6021/g.10337  ORF Transcript_6021/g.10337 Transcript_6021/m.10337 type:complete len:121 (+) Transcript_6021:302-664(+)
MPFPFHVDPEHKLLAKPGDAFYIIEEQDASKNFGGDYEGIKYDMVQPAYVLLDKSGAILQKWSWLSFQPPPDPMHWSTKVKVDDGEEGYLVRARPLSSDLLPSVQENRAPKLGICPMIMA